LLREGLREARRTSLAEEVRGEFAALDRALDDLQAGDLRLVLIDEGEEALAHLQARVNAEAGAQAKAKAQSTPDTVGISCPIHVRDAHLRRRGCPSRPDAPTLQA